MLTLSDLLKLLAYVAFFTILTVFYGIPIYIIRDLYMTMRSFSKRITDYVRYQAATRDMHARYPDATAEHLASDNTCIVCREEMRPFNPTAGAGGGAQPGFTMNERQRPKSANGIFASGKRLEFVTGDHRFKNFISDSRDHAQLCSPSCEGDE